jgi:hypothetical protein
MLARSVAAYCAVVILELGDLVGVRTTEQGYSLAVFNDG